MIIRLILAVAVFAGVASAAYADRLANTIGRVFGDLSGVGEAATHRIHDTQPRWMTIKLRPKTDCLAESSGVINTTYVRCHHGRHELTRFASGGNRVVLSGPAIPE